MNLIENASFEIQIGKPESFNELPEINRKRKVPSAVYEAIKKLKKGQSICFKSEKPNAIRSSIYCCLGSIKQGAYTKKRMFATRSGYKEGTTIIDSVIVFRTK